MRDLTRLLKPKSIAVIGGGAWCASIVSAAEQIGFDGVLHPVHPSGKQIAGRKSLPSLEEFPGPIDAAFIGVNRHATLEVVAQLRSLPPVLPRVFPKRLPKMPRRKIFKRS